MKVYIAGKITGLDEVLVLKKFNGSKRQLRKQGCAVMSPAVLASNDGFGHSDYMHVCLAMIDVCDAIYMQKDWRDSKGAKMELQHARSLKKKIFYEDENTREDSEQEEENSPLSMYGDKSEKEKCQRRHFCAGIPPGVISAPQTEVPAIPCHEKHGCENCACRTQKEKEL